MSYNVPGVRLVKLWRVTTRDRYGDYVDVLVLTTEGQERAIELAQTYLAEMNALDEGEPCYAEVVIDDFTKEWVGGETFYDSHS